MHSTNSEATRAIVSYVPALHAGYLAFFHKYQPANIFVLGKSFIDAFPRLNRDLRALAPSEAVLGLGALGFVADVLEIADLAILTEYAEIILPDEDVSRDFSEKYVTGGNVRLENIFLRWDGVVADKQKEVSPDRITSVDEIDKEFMCQAATEGQKSADWWRQIGSVLVKDGKVIQSAHIRYFPSDHALDIFGTPRTTVDFGQRPDLYISMHAEADLIAQAAKKGMSVEGATIYSSTFPCITCAFLMVRSGISRVYYTQGYANLDSDNVLRSAGVEIIYVQM